MNFETIGFWLMFGILILWPLGTYVVDLLYGLNKKLRGGKK